MTLRQRIIGVLEESPLPVPTPDLIALCANGQSYSRQRVWALIKRMEGRGQIERAGWRRVKRDNGMHYKVMTWVLG